MVGLSIQELRQQLEKIEFFDGGINEVAKIGGQIKNIVVNDSF